MGKEHTGRQNPDRPQEVKEWEDPKFRDLQDRGEASLRDSAKVVRQTVEAALSETITPKGAPTTIMSKAQTSTPPEPDADDDGTGFDLKMEP